MRLGDFKFQTERTNTPLNKTLLIGMLEDGPTARAFTFHRPDEAIQLLGDNDTTRAYRFLVNRGVPVEDILFYRLNGRAAEVTVNHNSTPLLHLRTINNSEKENDLSVRLNKDGLTLFSTYEDEDIQLKRRKDFSRTYRFADYSETEDGNTFLDVNQLCDAITSDALIGFHNIIAQSREDAVDRLMFDTLTETKLFVFEHGETEEHLCVKDGQIGQRELNDYTNRFIVYAMNQSPDGDIVSAIMEPQVEALYFPDFPVEKDPTLAKLAALLASQKTDEQKIMCTSLFHPSAVPGEQVLREDEYMVGETEYYNSLTGQIEPWLPDAKRNAYINKLNNLFEPKEKSYTFMQNLQIVVGDDRRNEGLIPAALYHLLDLLRKSPIDLSSNQELTDFSQINSELEKEVIASLNSNGYICSVPSIRRNVVLTTLRHFYEPVVFEPITYRAKRLISYMHYDLDNYLNSFIGGENTALKERDVTDWLNSYLGIYLERSALADYSVTVDAPSGSDDSAHISIELAFYDMVKAIQNHVSLDDQQRQVATWNLAID